MDNNAEDLIRDTLNELRGKNSIFAMKSIRPIDDTPVQVIIANQQFGFKLNDVSRYAVDQFNDREYIRIMFTDGKEITLYEDTCEFFRATINLLQSYLLGQSSINYPDFGDEDGYEECEDDEEDM
jgi:hypothetical protein